MIHVLKNQFWEAYQHILMEYFTDLVRENLLDKQLHTDRGQWSDDGMCQILDHVGKHLQFNCCFIWALLAEEDVISKFSILWGNFWKASIGTS